MQLPNAISSESLGDLLESVIVIAAEHPALSGRRQAVLSRLAELIQADIGVWAWGCGGLDAVQTVTPIASLGCGMNEQQRAAFMEYALDPDSDRNLRQRIRERMQSRQVTQSTDTRRDLFSDDEWQTFPQMRQMIERSGWSSWLHSVRYSASETWSNLFFLRNTGSDEFGPREAALVDLAMSRIPWLRSTADELLPPETFAGLTPRQRTVMLMLLDGMSRKSIALQLVITEDTVGDHLKSIYQHFQVNSSNELAALFLRSR
ncbi:MAG: helix-turn-helix transcriptional regulator [Planctomycetaceae bacterium]